jgi:endonuclease/exonuclease/phosphatase family metal-dependent hydrolase
LGAGPADLLTASRAGTPDRLRVATLNLLFYPQGDRWGERRPLVEDELRVLAPDVLGLQEVNRTIDQDHALAAAMGEGLGYAVHRASESIRPRYPRHWDGVVLLVRRAAGEVLFHEIRRLTYLRVVQALGIRTSGGRTVTIANTHLHHAGAAMRMRQVTAILGFLESLPRTEVTVLLGDLNALPDEPALELLFGAGFRSATREAGLGDPATFPSGLIAPTISRGPDEAIDYVLVRGRATIATARIAFNRPAADDAGLYPSDHVGIVADLAIG